MSHSTGTTVSESLPDDDFSDPEETRRIWVARFAVLVVLCVFGVVATTFALMYSAGRAVPRAPAVTQTAIAGWIVKTYATGPVHDSLYSDVGQKFSLPDYAYDIRIAVKTRQARPTTLLVFSTDRAGMIEFAEALFQQPISRLPRDRDRDPERYECDVRLTEGGFEWGTEDISNGCFVPWGDGGVCFDLDTNTVYVKR